MGSPAKCGKLIALLTCLGACQTPPAQIPADAARPVAPIPAPSGPEDAENPCMRDCLQQSQMEARAWEAIVADCRQTCAHADPH